MSTPTPEDKARAIFGERAALYTTSDSHTDQEILAWVVRLAKPRPEWKCLDVATGTGHTAFALAPHVSRVIATDITTEMLEQARGLQKKNGLGNVTFQVADVHDMPYKDGEFDLVTSRRAPHHFSDIRKALREMARVLRPGDRLVIDDRSIPEDDEVDRIMNRLDVLHDESHIRQYRPSEWRALLEEAGFTIESIGPFSKLRPLDRMKDGVDEDNVRKIDQIMADLTDRQKSIMQVVGRGPSLKHLHFFVMISAIRP